MTLLEQAVREEPVEDAVVVRVAWGDARWSRVQLLGELARGSWGMCRAQLGDVAGAWQALQESGRVVHAPKNEMSEHDE